MIEKLKTALEALQDAEKLANSRGFDRMDNSASQKLWYDLRDSCEKSAHDIKAVIAEMESIVVALNGNKE